jgi:hypothetical protein
MGDPQTHFYIVHCWTYFFAPFLSLVWFYIESHYIVLLVLQMFLVMHVLLSHDIFELNIFQKKMKVPTNNTIFGIKC